LNFKEIYNTIKDRVSGAGQGRGRLSGKWKVLGVILLMILVFIMYKTVDAKLNKAIVPVRTIAVKEQELTARVYTTGTLEATNLKEYYARGTTSVSEIRKEAGQRVSKGEAILLLDNNQALIDLEQAESTLVLQEAQYKQAVSDKALWEQKLGDAKKNVERLEKLYEIGGVSLKELETAGLEMAGAESQLSGIDLKSQEAQINKARLMVQTARKALAATVITSPIDGVILKIGVKEGQPVTPGIFLVSFGDPDMLEAVCSINEYDALKVREGQAAEVFSEGLREKKYKGYVAKIAPLAEMEQTSMGQENRVKLEIALEEKAAGLKPGYTINVSILIDQRPQTLVVPIEAVVERNERDVVFVVKDGRAELREVKKGLANELYQEITAGLSANEAVIISSLEKIQDKTRVKTNDNNKKPK
jgi:HlyD family secretion protein